MRKKPIKEGSYNLSIGDKVRIVNYDDDLLRRILGHCMGWGSSNHIVNNYLDQVFEIIDVNPFVKVKDICCGCEKWLDDKGYPEKTVTAYKIELYPTVTFWVNDDIVTLKKEGLEESLRPIKEENYFDKMETAFGVNHKHENMTDEEKNQFGDMEEIEMEKPKEFKSEEPHANSGLKKVQKDAGKDAIDYYKSIIDKMAKNQKSNVENPNTTRIGESKYDNALTKLDEGEFGRGLAATTIGMAIGAVHAFSVAQDYVDLFQDAYGETKEIRVGDTYTGKIIDITEHGKRYTNPYTGDEGGSPQQGFRVEVLTDEGDTIVFYEMTLDRGSLPQDGSTVSITIIEHPDTEYISPEMFSGQQYDVEMRENKKYDNALTRLEEEFEEPKVNIEDDEREMYYGTGMEGLRYDTDGTERQETLDKRMEELNDDEDNSTYNRLKKDGQKYKDYKYGKEKYNKAEDEYQETPRVKVTKGVKTENTMKNKKLIKENEEDLIKELMSSFKQKGLDGFVGNESIMTMAETSYDKFNEKYPDKDYVISSELSGRVKGSMILVIFSNKLNSKEGFRSFIYKMVREECPEMFSCSSNYGSQNGNTPYYLAYRPIKQKQNESKMVYKDVIKENTFKAKGKLVSEEQVLKLANKVPNRVKIDETIFAITDGDNSYRLIWEGEEAIITHSKNKKMVSESIDEMKRLYSFNTNDSISTKKTITESGEDSFKRMFNQMRNSDGLVDKTNDK